MTDAERKVDFEEEVKKVYPNARLTSNMRRTKWFVNSGFHNSRRIGEGKSQQEAWENAASALSKEKK